MSYEKAMQILKNGLNEQGFEYFLSLTEEQLNELCQYLSQEHQQLILDYMERRHHTPSKSTRPDFADSVRSAHSKIRFSEICGVKLASDEDSLQATARKPRSDPNENLFNYPFYGVIKRKMCSLLDQQPDSEAIKMMHSQLQSLFKQLLCEKLLSGLADTLSIKRNTFLLQKSKRLVDAKGFRHYLSEIFRKEYKSFKKFVRRTAKVTAGIEEEDLKAIEKMEKDQDNEEGFEEELESDDADKQQRQYFLKKTEAMTEQQFSQYADNRSLNFMVLGSQKLISFVDSQGTIIPRLKSKELLKLISYVLCRSLAQIVFRIISTKNHGVLEPVSGLTVTYDEVEHIGNDYVDRIRKRARTYALKLPTYLQKAQDLFASEFYSYSYDRILTNETKFKLTKDCAGRVEPKDEAETVWKKNRSCRRKWFERVEAESQYEAQQSRTRPPKKYVNGYAEYLFTHQSKVKQLGFSEVFRQYFTQQEGPLATEQTNFEDIANLKMESLFD